MTTAVVALVVDASSVVVDDVAAVHDPSYGVQVVLRHSNCAVEALPMRHRIQLLDYIPEHPMKTVAHL